MAKIAKFRSDQVENLAKITAGKRVAVFIDAANLYYAGSKAGIRISFESIIDWFKKHSKHSELNFYTAFDPEGTDQITFIETLAGMGYNIIKKPIKVFDSLTKGNMDIELAVDALTAKDNYDVIILMSGDGDFSYLVNKLKTLGKMTVIIGIGGFMSYELHKVGDHYFFLDRLSKIWQNKLRFNPQNYKIFLDTLQETDYNSPIHAPQYEEASNPVIIPEIEPKKRLEKLKLRVAGNRQQSHTKQGPRKPLNNSHK